jgi:hypothetical protein
MTFAAVAKSLALWAKAELEQPASADDRQFDGRAVNCLKLSQPGFNIKSRWNTPSCRGRLTAKPSPAR